MLNWLGGQEDVVDRFRRGDDPYLPMASLIYGEAVTDKKDPRRQTGKIAELQLGFGSGVKKFQSSAKRAGIDMPDDLAQRTVDRYRASHGKVVSLWREATSLLGELATGKTHRPWRILMVDGHCLVHPNGSWLDYSSLAWKEGEWRLYGRRGAWRRMYGSALVENVVQWLARIVAAEAMVRIERAGYPVVGMAHDDLWILVPENAAQRAPQVLVAIMSEMPSWAGGLPLAAECKIGKTYA